MNDYMPWIIGAGALALTFMGFYGGWVTRVAKGENAAEQARIALAATETVRADLAAFKTKVATDLSAFQTEVARDYASNRMIEQMEERLVKAIERLGDRLDQWVDRNPRPAPRTRVTKDRS